MSERNPINLLLGVICAYLGFAQLLHEPTEWFGLVALLLASTLITMWWRGER